MPDINTYLSLLPAASRSRPRFEALFRACLRQVMDLFALLDTLPAAYAVDTAVGVQLDALGRLAGLTRPAGESDEDFRMRLRCRMAKNRWQGMNDEIPAILAESFPGRTATLTDNGDGTVTAALSGTAPSIPLSELFPVPAGIGVT